MNCYLVRTAQFGISCPETPFVHPRPLSPVCPGLLSVMSPKQGEGHGWQLVAPWWVSVMMLAWPLSGSPHIWSLNTGTELGTCGREGTCPLSSQEPRAAHAGASALVCGAQAGRPDLVSGRGGSTQSPGLLLPPGRGSGAFGFLLVVMLSLRHKEK